MLLKEIKEIRNNQWKEYRKCKKNYKKANNAYFEAHSKIYESLHTYETVTESGIKRSLYSPCMKSTTEDLNGPASIDNLPLLELIQHYDDNCEHFSDCKETDCMHYKNYKKFKQAEENKNDAWTELTKAKDELKNAKKEFWQRIKNKIK